MESEKNQIINDSGVGEGGVTENKNNLVDKPRYQVGDIVVVGQVLRHIYQSPSRTDAGWLYPVDYGLGLTSEGFVMESAMRPYQEKLDRLKPL